MLDIMCLNGTLMQRSRSICASGGSVSSGELVRVSEPHQVGSADAVCGERNCEVHDDFGG